MNKIFLYGMGVLSLFAPLSVSAAEMFEVLPDLPDPLAYAVQPAQAATISGATETTGLVTSQSIGHEPSIISVVLSLLFVLLLIYLTGILYARLNRIGFKTLKKQQGDLAKAQVSVVSTTQLGNNKTLHVVELDGKRMLIGASASTIQLIKDLGSCNSDELDEEYSRIEIPNIKIPKIEIPKIEIPSIGFSKLVTKAHKCLKDVDTDNNKLEQEQNIVAQEEQIEEKLQVNEQEELSQDGIIDSLFAQQGVVEDAEVAEERSNNEHIVDPEDFALYKKYLG